MSVWGIGAYYSGAIKKDKTADFINSNCAFIGWSKTEAPPLHRMLDSIKIGDIIYIKSFVPRNKRLTIKAIGIVTNTKKIHNNSLGTGIEVKWKSGLVPFNIGVSPAMFTNNVYNNSLYEEFNEEILHQIINQLI